MKSAILFLSSVLLNFYFINAVFSQARLILNGAKINITNGASLVVDNAAGNAITRLDGHIISEGENNIIKWIIGTTADNYVIPWGLGNTDYLPLSFSSSSAVGAGTISFSTYQTGWQNSLSLPTGVTNVLRGGSDNSAYLIDRFWQINAASYTSKPVLTNLSFGYLDIEHSIPNNTITESLLAAQRWNDNSNVWSDLSPIGTDDAVNNRVEIPSLNASDLFNWWVLVQKDFALPLNFLSFYIQKSGNNANLIWTTTDQVNVKDFTIQKSFNGQDFTSIGTVVATIGNTINYYNFTDFYLPSGKMYYRIKENDLDGAFNYSDVRHITIDNSEMLQIYPNPVVNGKVTINALNVPTGEYTFSLYDIQSKLIYSGTIQLEKNLVTIQIPTAAPAGNYIVVISNTDFFFSKRIIIK